MRNHDSASGAQDAEITRADVEAAAMGYLARRDHAVGELREKLGRKGFPEALIDEVVAAFIAVGYLDDEQFARTQADILVGKQWGPLQISHKLKARGVSTEIVEGVLADIEAEVDWQAVCRARLRRKYGRDFAAMDQKKRAGAYRHLKYRGFFDHDIRRALFDSGDNG